MHRFFEKYKPDLGESEALKMIHDKVEKAKHKYKNHKDEKYLRELSEAYHMIEDFFATKGMDPKAFFELD